MTKPSDLNDMIAYFSEPLCKLQDKMAVAEDDLHLLKLQVQEIQDYIVNLTKALMKGTTDESTDPTTPE